MLLFYKIFGSLLLALVIAGNFIKWEPLHYAPFIVLITIIIGTVRWHIVHCLPDSTPENKLKCEELNNNKYMKILMDLHHNMPH